MIPLKAMVALLACALSLTTLTLSPPPAKADDAWEALPLGGLAYDPAAPDRVFLALGSGVKASADGGMSWADLGRQDLGKINALVLGIDGGNLYAATDQRLWRLRL